MVKSINHVSKFIAIDNVSSSLTLSQFTTGAYVSKYDSPQRYIPPCAQIRALCLVISPLGVLFHFKDQITLMILVRPALVLDTIFQYCCWLWLEISFSIASPNNALSSCLSICPR